MAKPANTKRPQPHTTNLSRTPAATGVGKPTPKLIKMATKGKTDHPSQQQLDDRSRAKNRQRGSSGSDAINAKVNGNRSKQLLEQTGN